MVSSTILMAKPGSIRIPRPPHNETGQRCGTRSIKNLADGGNTSSPIIPEPSKNLIIVRRGQSCRRTGPACLRMAQPRRRESGERKETKGDRVPTGETCDAAIRQYLVRGRRERVTSTYHEEWPYIDGLSSWWPMMGNDEGET